MRGMQDSGLRRRPEEKVDEQVLPYGRAPRTGGSTGDSYSSKQGGGLPSAPVEREKANALFIKMKEEMRSLGRQGCQSYQKV